MIKKNAFTVVEMLVSLTVTSILMLTVAAITNIGNSSYGKLRNEEAIYNDISYGFKLIQNRVHRTRTINIITGTNPWIGERLIVGNQAFGLYQASNSIDFVYLPDKTDENNREVILSVPNSETLNLNFAQTGKQISVRVYGRRHRTSFDISTTVKQRI